MEHIMFRTITKMGLSTLLKYVLLWSSLQTVYTQTLRYNVSEQVPSETFVANIPVDSGLSTKYNPDVFQQLRFSFNDPNEENLEYFMIESETGILRTRGVLDREEACPKQQTCVISMDILVNPRDYFQVITVIVNVVDINDRRPTFPQEAITLEIPESAPLGATYKLPEAEDLDSRKFAIQGYRMDTEHDDIFELNVIDVGGQPSKLQLKLLQSLDREQRDFYRINIIAYDGGSPPELGSMEVNIVVADSNDHGPKFLNSTYTVIIPETARPQTTVIRVLAQDMDIGINGEIRYAFSDNDHSDIFAINENTGEIVLKQTLDYEETQEYLLTVEATDGGVNSQPDYASVTVKIKDMNDNKPQISVNTLREEQSQDAVVSELAEIGDMVAYVSVKDPDSGLAGQFICNLNEPHFSLEQQSQSPSKFKVVTAAKLDRERQEEYALVIECQDNGNPSLVSTETIIVHILDENDSAPQFPVSTYNVELTENNHVKAWILQVNATDRDKGDNGKVKFSLGHGAGDQFLINPITGVIRANAVFDYEQQEQVVFTVIAYDNGDPVQSTTATVVLSILDTNDEPPKFTQDSYSFDVLENQPIGMEIGLVTASDADSDENNKIEFALLPSQSADKFTVDTQTGHVRTKESLDREQDSLYHLTVLATNIGVNPPLSASALITIQVQDDNDCDPIIDYPNTLNNTIYISNQVPVGYHVGIIQAHDRDLGDNAKLSFHISGGNIGGAFLLNPNTGVIETNIKLHSYDQKTFVIDISVTDHGFPQRVAKTPLHIVVNKSISYLPVDEQKTLLNNTNITIVVGLSVASVIIIVILVVAIVVIRRKERRKQQKHVYRCRVEAQKRIAGSKKDDSGSVASDTSGSKQVKKEVSFRLQKEGQKQRGSWAVPGVHRSHSDVSINTLLQLSRLNM